ncbi:hypothetical protein [Sinorhizobium fredii]|uniref:hypothetical protein n=1 Tax=Rhizobium fredii TaxID=380 RepID=UPI000595676A|nr:hypothetical protein [Sinorhizobium fredii]WOS65928.1 hypothetical protein SFGR64A_19490 [Sinorhizobium fredii GR64]
MRAAPVLREIVRQHAEQAAFLWTVYDYHLLHPDENPEMDEVRLARLIERLEAHLDGLRVAGEAGREIARALYKEYPERGELFVLRMLADGAETLRIAELDLPKVRAYLTARLG